MKRLFLKGWICNTGESCYHRWQRPGPLSWPVCWQWGGSQRGFAHTGSTWRRRKCCRLPRSLLREQNRARKICPWRQEALSYFEKILNPKKQETATLALERLSTSLNLNRNWVLNKVYTYMLSNCCTTELHCWPLSILISNTAHTAQAGLLSI